MQAISLVVTALFAFVVGGVSDFSAVEDWRAEYQACPLGWSQIVQRKAGLSSYPAYCTMPSCRPASTASHGHAVMYATDPLCNPVTGANCGSILYWHYDYVLSGSSSGACPADVVGGPWSTKSN